MENWAVRGDFSANCHPEAKRCAHIGWTQNNVGAVRGRGFQPLAAHKPVGLARFDRIDFGLARLRRRPPGRCRDIRALAGLSFCG